MHAVKHLFSWSDLIYFLVKQLCHTNFCSRFLVRFSSQRIECFPKSRFFPFKIRLFRKCSHQGKRTGAFSCYVFQENMEGYWYSYCILMLFTKKFCISLVAPLLYLPKVLGHWPKQQSEDLKLSQKKISWLMTILLIIFFDIGQVWNQLYWLSSTGQVSLVLA